MNKKATIFIHVIIMYLTFFLGEWIRMFAFKTNLCEPYDEFLSIFINISMVLLVISLYSFSILKKPIKKFMICKPLPRCKWCIIALLVPVAILFFYLNCLDGTLERNIVNQEDIIYIFSYTILRTGICAGIVEEIIFRGMIMNLLENVFSRKQAILFSSLLFASIHLSNIDISYITDTIFMLISTTIAGIALSLVAYETGSIWSSSVIHGMYNIIISGQILEIATEHNFLTIWNYTPDTRDILFTGGEFGITAGLPTVIGFLLIIIIAKIGLCKKNDTITKDETNTYINQIEFTSDFLLADIKEKKALYKKSTIIETSIKRVIYAFLILSVTAFCCILVNRFRVKELHVNDEIAIATVTSSLTESEKNTLRESNRYQSIIQQRACYPTRMIEDLERNPEIIDFVEGYKDNIESAEGKFTQEEMSTPFPLLMQWDKRWGYKSYGNSIIGLSGCGPTCLSMVIFSLTRASDATPDSIAKYSMDKGYYIEGVGTAWSLMTDVAEDYGITVNIANILSEEEIKKYIYGGSIVICSMGPGDFTDQGHFIVIRGYNNDGFVINDPFSYTNSSHEWDYEQFASQICQMWVYTLK